MGQPEMETVNILFRDFPSRLSDWLNLYFLCSRTLLLAAEFSVSLSMRSAGQGRITGAQKKNRLREDMCHLHFAEGERKRGGPAFILAIHEYGSQSSFYSTYRRRKVCLCNYKVHNVHLFVCLLPVSYRVPHLHVLQHRYY